MFFERAYKDYVKPFFQKISRSYFILIIACYDYRKKTWEYENGDYRSFGT